MFLPGIIQGCSELVKVHFRAFSLCTVMNYTANSPGFKLKIHCFSSFLRCYKSYCLSNDANRAPCEIHVDIIFMLNVIFDVLGNKYYIKLIESHVLYFCVGMLLTIGLLDRHSIYV